MAVLSDGPGAAPFTARAAERAGRFIHISGAVMSLVLLAGISVWGYRLLVRDVTGIPVVRAVEGPMRVAPPDAGGQIAPHVGLAVNAVAARGEAAPSEDVLVLAPTPVSLAPEDMEVQSMAEAGELSPGDLAGDELVPVLASIDGPLSAEDVLALADQIAAGAEPMALLDDQSPGAVAPPAGGWPMEIIPASIPGVNTAPYPPMRPQGFAQLASATVTDPGPATSAAATTGGLLPLTTAEMPVGTTLVQLGAFDSIEIASAEWANLSRRFADFIGGKNPIVQEAESGGRTFFRLRAMGFADLADARRFCAVLAAEDANCIPVVVR